MSAWVITTIAAFFTATLSFAIAEFVGLADDDEEQPVKSGGSIDREN